MVLPGLVRCSALTPRVGHRSAFGNARAGSDLRQPEVQNLRVPAIGHEKIRRLDVAMDNALGVRCVQSIGDLDGQREQRVQVERAPVDRVLQGHALQIFHGNEGQRRRLADFINRADVRMVQGRCGSRLAPETLQGLRVARQFLGQEFQGYKATQVGVFGLIDHTHPAAAQLFNHAVMRNGFANQ